MLELFRGLCGNLKFSLTSSNGFTFISPEVSKTSTLTNCRIYLKFTAVTNVNANVNLKLLQYVWNYSRCPLLFKKKSNSFVAFIAVS